MDTNETSAATEVIHTALDAVAAAERQAEVQSEITDIVIAQAQEQIDAAQHQAAEIAEAAMATEIGRRVSALEEKTWHVQDELRQALTELQTQMATLSGQIAATATLAVETTAAALSPSIQPTIAAEPEIMPPLVEVLPETLQNVVDENPAPEPAPARKTRRWT